MHRSGIVAAADRTRPALRPEKRRRTTRVSNADGVSRRRLEKISVCVDDDTTGRESGRLFFCPVLPGSWKFFLDSERASDSACRLRRVIFLQRFHAEAALLQRADAADAGLCGAQGGH